MVFIKVTTSYSILRSPFHKLGLQFNMSAVNFQLSALGDQELSSISKTVNAAFSHKVSKANF